jgi:hypothetical protein
MTSKSRLAFDYDDVKKQWRNRYTGFQALLMDDGRLLISRGLEDEWYVEPIFGILDDNGIDIEATFCCFLRDVIGVRVEQ